MLSARITTLFILVTLAAAEDKLPPPVDIKVDFEKHIQPLLAEKCHSCHGEQVQQSGLRLDRRQAALRGGVYGPVIIPGNSAESKLTRRLVSGDGGLQMPPTGRLSDYEIGLLRAWIDQGADFRLQIEDEKPRKPVDPKVALFISAIGSGEIGLVERLIAADPEVVKARDAAGSTPLHHAAGFSTHAMLALLLDKGADPNAANRRKSTPLFWAIHDEAKVRLLIGRGADVNASLVDGRTPVYQAASLGNGISVLRLLLSKGANPDVKTVTGVTPLMAAARRGDPQTMHVLIEKGADVNTQDAAGATALMAASTNGSAAAVGLLLEKGADPNRMTKRKQTALADAATVGVAETVKLLIDRGAGIDVQDDRGYTPLLYAAGSDAVPAAVVKMLLANGANPELKGDGETARMLAAKRGDTEVARLLGVPAGERRRLGVVQPPERSGRERPISEAVTAGLALLEKQSHNFIRIGGCNSCHAQDLPSAASAFARSRGITAPMAIAQLPRHMHPNTPERMMDLAILGINAVGISWELFDLGMNGAPRDQYTNAAIRCIKALQTADGSWHALQNRRPPMSSGAYQATALAVYGLRHYGPPAEAEDTQRAIARAATWLESANPRTTQDRAFRLLGLAWSSASRAEIETTAKALADTQRADGGWSQLSTMGSDAYATGQALYALNVAGRMQSTNSIYQKGIKYLLRTQAPDGSWHVKSRSIWVQPYFESGFPYGHDQWISAAGTAWATMALSATVEPHVKR